MSDEEMRVWAESHALVGMPQAIWVLQALRRIKTSDHLHSGAAGRKGGKACAAKMSPEQRKERASKAAKAMWAKMKSFSTDPKPA